MNIAVVLFTLFINGIIMKNACFVCCSFISESLRKLDIYVSTDFARSGIFKSLLPTGKCIFDRITLVCYPIY